jgi:hypothetical protein
MGSCAAGRLLTFGSAVSHHGDYSLPVSVERERLLRIYRERVAGYSNVSEDFRDRWLAWCRALLARGGDLVVPPLHPESDLDQLLATGAFQGHRVQALKLGGDCHANVASSGSREASIPSAPATPCSTMRYGDSTRGGSTTTVPCWRPSGLAGNMLG